MLHVLIVNFNRVVVAKLNTTNEDFHFQKQVHVHANDVKDQGKELKQLNISNASIAYFPDTIASKCAQAYHAFFS